MGLSEKMVSQLFVVFHHSQNVQTHLSFICFTIWLFNIAMENGPFIDDFPIKTSIYKGFSMAMLNNQMVQQRKAHEHF